MPIKFRCPHCRQFLGISPSQAGTIVDCPTCGRAVRVPHADGRLEPLPPPELDLHDARLRAALDELALIGAGPLRKSAAGQPDEPERDRSQGPVALDNPEPIAAPSPGPTPSRPSAADEPSLADALSELARLSPAHPPPAIAVETAPPAQRGRWLALLALSVLAAFSLGYLAGRSTPTATERPPAETTSGPLAADATNDDPPAGPLNAPSITGRITWRTPEGDSRPDRGARLFVLPDTFAGEQKLPVSALQADAGSPSYNDALQQLRSMGGDLAVVDDDGHYKLTVPAAGVYTLLALSNYQPRGEDQPPEPGIQSLLEKHFDRPPRLLGSTQHRAAQLRLSGEGTLLWDHSFERP